MFTRQLLTEKIIQRRGLIQIISLEQGQDKILKKIGEEATGIVIASKNPNPEELKTEMADFLYHAMVLMVEKGITWEDITNQLLQK